MGDELTQAAVSRRPPISLSRSVARTHMYTYDADIWDLSLVQAIFCRPVPNLSITYATFASLYAAARTASPFLTVNATLSTSAVTIATLRPCTRHTPRVERQPKGVAEHSASAWRRMRTQHTERTSTAMCVAPSTLLRGNPNTAQKGQAAHDEALRGVEGVQRVTMLLLARFPAHSHLSCGIRSCQRVDARQRTGWGPHYAHQRPISHLVQSSAPTKAWWRGRRRWAQSPACRHPSPRRRRSWTCPGRCLSPGRTVRAAPPRDSQPRTAEPLPAAGGSALSSSRRTRGWRRGWRRHTEGGSDAGGWYWPWLTGAFAQRVCTERVCTH
jgi:hypothetical protein